jgi:hypothetical protein
VAAAVLAGRRRILTGGNNIVARSAAAPMGRVQERATGCGTLDGVSALLVARLHVDLQRVTSAACRPAD